MRGEHLRTFDSCGPWAELAAAVVQRAIDDARGYALTSKCSRHSHRLATEAVDWLAAGGCGLLDMFGLDADAVTESLSNERQQTHSTNLPLATRHGYGD
jgi:hypothetical protein